MIERTLPVINRLGLHARAAAKLVQCLSKFKATVELKREHRQVNAKSIMGVMMLAAARGSTLTARIDGPDEIACADALSALFAARFDEPE
jgi:phosphocarrier protein HPr